MGRISGPAGPDGERKGKVPLRQAGLSAVRPIYPKRFPFANDDRSWPLHADAEEAFPGRGSVGVGIRIGIRKPDGDASSVRGEEEPPAPVPDSGLSCSDSGPSNTSVL